MKLTRTAALVLATAVAVLVPTAAQAKTYTHADAVGDMLAFSDASPDAATPAPDHANADVIASVVKHKRRAVLMQMTYRDLVADQDHVVGHYFRIKTPTMRRDVMILTGSLFGTGGKARLTKPNGKSVACKVSHSIDYATHSVTVKVPRRCLGNPRWIKVGMGAFSSDGDPTSSTSSTSPVSYADDALADGGVHNGLTYSPKVRR